MSAGVVAAGEDLAPARRRLGRPPPTLLLGAALLLLFFACAAVPAAIAPFDPLAFDFAGILQPPSAAHWFGTDNFGRDVLSRTIWAARVDLQIAVFGTVGALASGVALGALAGFLGGAADAVFGRVVDMVVTIPFLVLVIGIVAILGPGLGNMFVAITLVGWVTYARLIRAEILVQKEQDYAQAARVLGYSRSRLLAVHLLPNTITPVLTYWVTEMALVILLGSSLGYLGLGAQPPTAEWGVLIADGKNYMSTAWWLSVCPGIAIVLAGVAFSLTGDGLAAWLRTRRS
jgi:peptide/nickel transport system permease protein